MLVGSILIGADELIGEIVKAKIPYMRGKSWGGIDPVTRRLTYSALGVVRRGVLVGGVVYHNFQDFDIQMSCAFTRSDWALRGTIRALFDYPFNTLNCVRVTSVVGRRNKAAKKLLSDLGFKLEGVREKALDGVEDEFCFGLLKENCRWIHGQEITTASATAA